MGARFKSDVTLCLQLRLDDGWLLTTQLWNAATRLRHRVLLLWREMIVPLDITLLSLQHALFPQADRIYVFELKSWKWLFFTVRFTSTLARRARGKTWSMILWLQRMEWLPYTHIVQFSFPWSFQCTNCVMILPKLRVSFQFWNRNIANISSFLNVTYSSFFFFCQK